MVVRAGSGYLGNSAECFDDVWGKVVGLVKMVEVMVVGAFWGVLGLRLKVLCLR